MENATDALKMAAAVLIFVLALSISINSFSEVRATSQKILNYNDKEYDYTYVQDNGSTERIVGIETIIPSIYRAYAENYKIIFLKNDGTKFKVYDKETTEGTEVANYIDLEQQSIPKDFEITMADYILYGERAKGSDNWNQIEKKFNEKDGSTIVLQSSGIYDTIKGMKFKEYLGVYYQGEEEGKNSAPDANKVKKRVITYQEV